MAIRKGKTYTIHKLLVLKEALRVLEKIGPDIKHDFILDLNLMTANDICGLAEELDRIIKEEARRLNRDHSPGDLSCYHFGYTTLERLRKIRRREFNTLKEIFKGLPFSDD
jgi:hypothetical protein